MFHSKHILPQVASEDCCRCHILAALLHIIISNQHGNTYWFDMIVCNSPEVGHISETAYLDTEPKIDDWRIS